MALVNVKLSEQQFALSMTVEWDPPGCEGGFTERIVIQYCQMKDENCLNFKCKTLD